MRTILVLGGYGGFGGRISTLLAARGLDVIVAGRSPARATSFCARRDGLRAAAIDRDLPLDEHLATLKPWLTIDAAGPFQNSDYRVPKACIARGVHYVDLADARDFVTGIGALDGAARRAGVSVLAGASSLPALSTAVVDTLADGLDAVGSIDIALSASNRASGSASVTRAILSYVGRPIRLWRGGRWDEGHGWQEMTRVGYAVPGHRPLAHRVALCEVPDLDLLPARYPGRPATRFRAGTEIELQNLALRLLSAAVRGGVFRSALGFAPLGLWVQRRLHSLGGDRSAMRVTLRGALGARQVERRWTLLAERGDGPWVPCLASVLLADKLEASRLKPGAMTAAGLLTLDDFEPLFGKFALFTATGEADAPPLYKRIMREEFERLPTVVQRLHEPCGELGASGRATVERPRHPIARLIGRVFGFPPAMTDAPLTIEMREEHGGETWTRCFNGHTLVSRMRVDRGYIVERFGLLNFRMQLRREADGLTMHQCGWKLGPLPMPRRLGPRGTASERAIDGRFHFDVPIALPLVGLLIHYRGWLEIEPPGDPTRS